jgi:hypothetical protein
MYAKATLGADFSCTYFVETDALVQRRSTTFRPARRYQKTGAVRCSKDNHRVVYFTLLTSPALAYAAKRSFRSSGRVQRPAPPHSKEADRDLRRFIGMVNSLANPLP